jgi:hypothetical protein
MNVSLQYKYAYISLLHLDEVHLGPISVYERFIYWKELASILSVIFILRDRKSI